MVVRLRLSTDGGDHWRHVWQIAIFNRWGQKVFETKDTAKGWVGTMNGMDQLEGNYVYLIRYTNLLGEVKSLSGSVILIR